MLSRTVCLKVNNIINSIIVKIANKIQKDIFINISFSISFFTRLEFLDSLSLLIKSYMSIKRLNRSAANTDKEVIITPTLFLHNLILNKYSK